MEPSFPTALDLVQKALPTHGFTAISIKIGYKPKKSCGIKWRKIEEVEAFLAAIDNDDDVDEVYVSLAG